LTNTKTNNESPFNEEFCTRLEYRLCKEFTESDDIDLKYFWCDGVSWFPDENQLTKKHINDKRKIVTKAWIGKDGQDVYQAIIHFGRKALSRYAKGLNLIKTIPEIGTGSEWIFIDTENRIIEIKLN